MQIVWTMLDHPFSHRNLIRSLLDYRMIQEDRYTLRPGEPTEGTSSCHAREACMKSYPVQEWQYTFLKTIEESQQTECLWIGV